MSKIKLADGEKFINNWTLNYLPTSGGRYTGVLTVTDKNVYFESKFDTSFSAVVSDKVFVVEGDDSFVKIPKDKIKDVSLDNSFFSKKVIITLDDDSKHVFHYGILSVKKIGDAINEK